MNILSSFTHPLVSPNLHDLIFFVELNRRYAGNQTILAPVEKKYYGSQWEPKLFGYCHSNSYII